MEIDFLDNAITDIEYWRKSGNKNIQSKITKLLESIRETPYAGIGKPEALKHELSGYWSRRINAEHRIVYTVLVTGSKSFPCDIITTNKKNRDEINSIPII